MRERHPVFYDEQRQGWQILRYADVRRVLEDHDTFSSAVPTSPDIPPLFLLMDEPAHQMQRSIVEPAFKEIGRLIPRIQAIVNAQLAPVLETGSMDLVQDIATPIPVQVIAHLIGLPEKDWQQFLAWTDAVSLSSSLASVRLTQQMHVYLHEQFEQRRKDPQPDLLTSIVENGDKNGLSERDLVGICYQLLGGGSETTRHLISWFFVCLSEPQLRSMRTNPSMLPLAIEEVARLRPPLPLAFRMTRRSVTLSGQVLAAGQPIFPSLISANHDPDIFADPDVVLLTRKKNPHLSFSVGKHFCLGAGLARLEARIILQTLLSRLKDIQRTSDDLSLVGGLNYGIKSLPITFQI
jgi:cytochrome P450